MAFRIENIHGTKALNLDFTQLRITESRLPTKENAPNWKCAIKELDQSKTVVFTQLASSSGEMCDGRYYYLLVISNDPILIEWDAGKASIYDEGNAASYSAEYLKQTVDEAAVVLNYDHKPFIWKQNNQIPQKGYLTNA